MPSPMNRITFLAAATHELTTDLVTTVVAVSGGDRRPGRRRDRADDGAGDRGAPHSQFASALHEHPPEGSALRKPACDQKGMNANCRVGAQTPTNR